MTDDGRDGLLVEGYCWVHDGWAYLSAMGPDCQWTEERDG